MVDRLRRVVHRVWPRRRDREIDEEIAAHLAMAVRDRIARGESPDAARHAALREFGNLHVVTDATRRVWISVAAEQFWQDLRFGVRVLWQAPAFCATAAFLVALVIGANTTIYSMVRSILVSPPQGITTDRLVVLKRLSAGTPLADPFFSYPDFVDYARSARTVQQLAAWSSERLTIATDAGIHAIVGGVVTANYHDTFGVTLTTGRRFTPDDNRPGAPLVAIVSERLWRERFGSEPDLIGRAITVGGKQAAVVGIAGGGFAGALINMSEDIWLPIAAYHGAGANSPIEQRELAIVAVAGQLAPGASLAEARAELATLTAQLRAAYPDIVKETRAYVADYSGTSLLPIADMAPYFLAAFSIITLLTLIIVSANVANLMLGRAVERQRETAVRQSLGASKPRVLRLLVAEGTAIAAVAWLTACLVAWWTTKITLGILEPQPGLFDHIRPDWTLAATAMLLALCATIAFTVAPAIQTWRLPLLPLLKSGAQSVVSGRSRLSSGLVVLQLAFSVVLLTSAGLALRSLSLLDSGDVGFDPERMLLVTMRVGHRTSVLGAAPSPKQEEAERAALERVRERLRDDAVVAAVSYTRRAPGAYMLSTRPVGTETGDETTPAYVRPVGPDYQASLGLTLTAGRDLAPTDRLGAARVAVINRQLADDLWPGQSPVGRMLRLTDRGEAFEIVGVAPNALVDGPVHDARPHYVFIAHQQVPDPRIIDMTFYVRYRGTLDSATPRIGRAIGEVDGSLPIVSMTTMRSRLESVTVIERQVTLLLIIFGGASLLVASLGQYAVSAFNMRRRVRDFGVRMALGASAAQIQRSVISESLRLTLIGLTVGFFLSVAAGLALGNRLFGIAPTDPATYTGVFVLLALASVAAAYLPAWRAGQVNVVEALRQE
jgi:predicted permease